MMVTIPSAWRGIPLFVVAMLVSSGVLLGLHATAGAQSLVAVSLQPSGATLLPGDTVAFDVIVADGLIDLYGAQIEVSFDIDANGILNVSAKDLATNKEQSIAIDGSSGLSDEEVSKMQKDADVAGRKSTACSVNSCSEDEVADVELV